MLATWTWKRARQHKPQLLELQAQLTDSRSQRRHQSPQSAQCAASMELTESSKRQHTLRTVLLTPAMQRQRNRETLLTVRWEHHLGQCTTAGSKDGEFHGVTVTGGRYRSVAPQAPAHFQHSHAQHYHTYTTVTYRIKQCCCYAMDMMASRH